MSQTIILNNIQKFLSLTTPISQEDPDFFKRLLNEGHCYALSLCYAAMHQIGKLQWWEAALVEIANWDGDPEKLNEVISLPDADIANTTLKDIFLRITNYVFYHQFGSISKLNLEVATNMDVITDPHTAYFEILDKAGKVKKIKKNEIMAGSFNDKLLKKLLSKDIDDAICIVSNPTHAIAVIKEKNSWVVYNPNYSHLTQSQMTYTSSDINEVVTEIKRIQNSLLDIQIIYLDKKSNSFDAAGFFKSLSDDDILDLLEEGGFTSLCVYNADLSYQCLTRIVDNKKYAERLLKTMVTQDPNAWNGLMTLAHYHGTLIPRLFATISEVPGAAQALVQLLPKKNKQQLATLHKFSYITTACFFPLLLETIYPAKHAERYLFDALQAKDKSGATGFERITACNPKFVENLLPFMCRGKFAKSLIKLISEEKLVTAEILHEIFNLLNKYSEHHDIANKLKKLLSANNYALLFSVINLAPQLLYKFNVSEIIADALISRDENGRTGLYHIANHMPAQFLQVIKLAAESPKITRGMLLEAHTELFDSAAYKNIHKQYKLTPQQITLCKLNPYLQYVLVTNNLVTDVYERRELSLRQIKKAIGFLKTNEEIRAFIGVFEKNMKEFFHLFERQGHVSTLSLYGHTWKGVDTTATWVDIVNTAKQKMIELKQGLCEEDTKFLKTSTQKRNFFARPIDYYTQCQQAITVSARP